MWQIVLEADRLNVPVVLMTGDPAQKDEAKTGARPYIFKPFQLSQLKHVLEEAVFSGSRGNTPDFVGPST
jgi:FixJ family two-component response regulator